MQLVINNQGPLKHPLFALYSAMLHNEDPAKTRYFEHPFSDQPLAANIFVDALEPALGKKFELTPPERDWMLSPDSVQMGTLSSSGNLIVPFIGEDAVTPFYRYSTIKHLQATRTEIAERQPVGKKPDFRRHDGPFEKTDSDRTPLMGSRSCKPLVQIRVAELAA